MILNIYVDGASKGNPGPSGIGIIIKEKNGKVLERITEHKGEMTNNLAEYEAVKKGLEEALRFKPKKVNLFSDSELIVMQLNGVYKVKNASLSLIFREVKSLVENFDEVSIEHIPREENVEADSLANQAVQEQSGVMKEKKQSVGKGYYEMTVKDSFDAAHYLINYPGKCVNLHGHTWDVEVVVGGEKLNEIGLLYDFRSLKKILKELLNKFDHKYLNEIAPFDKESPTAENLACYLFKKLSESVPSEIKLIKVTVWESLEAKVTYSE